MSISVDLCQLLAALKRDRSNNHTIRDFSRTGSVGHKDKDDDQDQTHKDQDKDKEIKSLVLRAPKDFKLTMAWLRVALSSNTSLIASHLF